MLVDPIQTEVTWAARALRGCGYVSGLFSIANPGRRRHSAISLNQSQHWAGFRLALTMYPPTSHDEGLSSRHAP
jgi:hypothetical protein